MTRGARTFRWLSFLPVAWAAVCASPPAPSDRTQSAARWAKDLQHQDYWVRWYAAYALGRLGADSVSVAPALERLLANLDEHEYVRGTAAWALGRLGPQAAEATPLLVQVLSSRHISVRRNAAMALGCIAAPGSSAKMSTPGPQTEVLAPKDMAALTGLLDDPDPMVKIAAAQSLWRMKRLRESLTLLETMLQDANAGTGCAAAVALGELAAEGAPVAKALVAALSHADADVRRAAAQAIGRAGPEAIPLLRGALAADERTQIEAIEALGWMGTASVGALTEALGHSSASVRRHAVRALGRMGPAARSAEPALIQAVSDSDAAVRDAAARALKRVRGLHDRQSAP